MLISDLETPAVVVDLDVMERNLSRMAEYSRRQNLRLRPYTKSHKIPELAQRQIDKGASGITVAKIGEAEVMLNAGISDIHIAYPIVGAEKARRLAALFDLGFQAKGAKCEACLSSRVETSCNCGTFISFKRY